MRLTSVYCEFGLYFKLFSTLSGGLQANSLFIIGLSRQNGISKSVLLAKNQSILKFLFKKNLALEMLEEACYCLIASQMNKQAEEKADECLAREDFSDIRKAAFWCIKGDIHDNEEFYNKAWELSKHRNARSMRSLGALLVHKKRYEEAADAFQLGKYKLQLIKGVLFASQKTFFLEKNFS
jgi:hypothetical protein